MSGKYGKTIKKERSGVGRTLAHTIGGAAAGSGLGYLSRKLQGGRNSSSGEKALSLGIPIAGAATLAGRGILRHRKGNAGGSSDDFNKALGLLQVANAYRGTREYNTPEDRALRKDRADMRARQAARKNKKNREKEGSYMNYDLEEAFRDGYLLEMDKIALLGSYSEAAKGTSKEKAEAYGRVGANARKNRKEDTGEYIFNPHVGGPITEVTNRLGRRHHASKIEHPTATSLIPFYGMVRGGKAGRHHIEKQKEREADARYRRHKSKKRR